MSGLSEQLRYALELQQNSKYQESIILLKKLIKVFPEDYRIPWLIGTSYLGNKDFKRSENYLKRSLKISPNNASASNTLGMLKLEQKHYSEAYAAFLSASKSEPDDVHVLGNLSIAAVELGNYEAAISHAEKAYIVSGKDTRQAFRYANALSRSDLFDQAINVLRQVVDVAPNYVEAWMNLGNNLKIRGLFGQAKEVYETALRLDPNNAGIKFNLGLLLLRETQSDRGWQLYESRRALVEFQDKNLLKLNAPYWMGDDLNGKTILVYSEQGRGDTLHYCRYLAWVKSLGAAKVILYGDTKMKTLFQSLNGLDEWISEGEKVPKHHFRISIMSLPSVYFKLKGDYCFEHPYLVASEASLKFWSEHFETSYSSVTSSLKVGIVWQGNPGFQWDRYRSIPLKELTPIIEDQTLDVYSLQVFDPTNQLEALYNNAPSIAARLKDLTHLIRQRGAVYDDTAALLMQLDVIVTTDTSMTHLCGALGIPTLVLQGAYSDWRYGTDETKVPDYPSLTLCREDEWGNWPTAVNKAHKYLRDMRDPG